MIKKQLVKVIRDYADGLKKKTVSVDSEKVSCAVAVAKTLMGVVSWKRVADIVEVTHPKSNAPVALRAVDIAVSTTTDILHSLAQQPKILETLIEDYCRNLGNTLNRFGNALEEMEDIPLSISEQKSRNPEMYSQMMRSVLGIQEELDVDVDVPEHTGMEDDVREQFKEEIDSLDKKMKKESQE